MGNKNKSIKIFSGVLAGLLLFAVVLYSLYYVGRQRETKRDQIADIVTFSSLPVGAVVEASIDMNGKTEPVAFIDGKLVLSPEQQKTFHLPYFLRANVKYTDNSYRDFYWNVSLNGAEYYIGASGFSPKDRVILAINNQPTQNIPFDWSGRIEFPIFLIIAEDQKSCVYIETKNGEKPGACHHTVGKAL